MRGWSVSGAFLAGLLTAPALAACGGTSQYASEPTADFPVAVAQTSFPASQTLSQHTQMVIAVRNTGTRPIPRLAVTVCNVSCAFGSPAGEGTSAAPFAVRSNTVRAANPSSQVWIVDRPPGTCTGPRGYSCAAGGPGADATSSANTWALPAPLNPGATANFTWAVTAVKTGTYTVAWQLAAGLAGRARAVLADGSIPHGTFTVAISNKPAQQYVNNNGQVVSGTGQGQP